jgi:hypothetical protein
MFGFIVFGLDGTYVFTSCFSMPEMGGGVTTYCIYTLTRLAGLLSITRYPSSHIAFIAGYAEDGAPSGITWTEWEGLDDW